MLSLSPLWPRQFAAGYGKGGGVEQVGTVKITCYTRCFPTANFFRRREERVLKNLVKLGQTELDSIGGMLWRLGAEVIKTALKVMKKFSTFIEIIKKSSNR